MSDDNMNNLNDLNNVHKSDTLSSNDVKNISNELTNLALIEDTVNKIVTNKNLNPITTILVTSISTAIIAFLSICGLFSWNFHQQVILLQNQQSIIDSQNIILTNQNKNIGNMGRLIKEQKALIFREKQNLGMKPKQ